MDFLVNPSVDTAFTLRRYLDKNERCLGYLPRYSMFPTDEEEINKFCARANRAVPNDEKERIALIEELYDLYDEYMGRLGRPVGCDRKRL